MSEKKPAFGLSRRQFIASNAVLFMAGVLPGCHRADPLTASSNLLGFDSVAVELRPDFDSVTVADGYRAEAFFSWGDPVLHDAPEWRGDATEDWHDQLRQSGEDHDGMHYFPFPDAPNDHGLLVINHEDTNDTLHPNGPTVMTTPEGYKQRPLGEVRKEQAAVGASVIEIRRDQQGRWQRVFPSRYNRRISMHTPMRLSGPAAGIGAMKTVADPDGLEVLGTMANCAMGYTPWGTYLTCEENWHDYFVNRDAEDFANRPAHARYDIKQGKFSREHQWEMADPRFNATPQQNLDHQGYVNEPNRFGWVVEFDPFDPTSVPVKRTAMGRFQRECATLNLAEDGSMAFYSGDDDKGEYLYKFVPSGKYNAVDNTANRDLLDQGTLYVARLDGDGSENSPGRWLPLVFGKNGLDASNGFHSQGDVVILARKAADIVGATSLDRPEWVAVHPQTRECFVSLTKNEERGVDPAQPVSAVNPRAENLYGQIIRWREKDNSPAATEFVWEHFLFAGDDSDGGTIQGDAFACPDGMWFDPAGRLWIETDFADEKSDYQSFGTNQLLCADPQSGEVRRFLVGPVGCEITGITGTPDGKSLWINVQHPERSYPASDGQSRPRSTTVLISKLDGGVIGS